MTKKKKFAHRLSDYEIKQIEKKEKCVVTFLEERDYQIDLDPEGMGDIDYATFYIYQFTYNQ